MSFDYVIVGGGSAGCVLANRLSEDPNISVCLLEAGPPDRHPLIHVPLGILWMMRSKVLNWNFYTQPEPEMGQRRMFWPRGRTLGGSSSSNAMCYLRGHPADYDEWAALGNPGWSFADVLPYFKRSQNQERGASTYHGVGGPLNVADLRSPSPLTGVFVKAGMEAGLPHNTDFNGENAEGVGPFQVTQIKGRRCSTARAYLTPVRSRSNLTVLTNAHATKIVIEQKRAVAVDFLQGGRSRRVAAKREVILSAGAVQSPRLLMLSGVGDREQLLATGVEPVHHLPGVGQNLQDHLDVILVQRCRLPVTYGITWRNLALGAVNLYRYLTAGRGMFTTNGAEGCAVARGAPTEPLPDLQFHFSPGKLRKHSRDLKFLCGDGYSLHVCNLRPKSRGEIRLASADPLAQPIIHANYLTHPDDMEHMLKGFKLARRILAAPAFAEYRGEEIVPGAAIGSDDEIRQFIRNNAETIYHPVSTCKMGSDPLAVVDARLCVHGLDGLRVVDASIMPTLIGGNTNGPTVMIAEKAADMIKAARQG